VRGRSDDQQPGAESMKITPQQIKLVARLYREQKQIEPRRIITENGAPLDKVTLSEEGLEIQTIIARLKDIPEIRDEKIAELRAAIKNGTYQVSGKDVAERLLDRLSKDEILTEDV
jgi:negative regulator of flagellin synthesis FlgM